MKKTFLSFFVGLLILVSIWLLSIGIESRNSIPVASLLVSNKYMNKTLGQTIWNTQFDKYHIEPSSKFYRKAEENIAHQFVSKEDDLTWIKVKIFRFNNPISAKFDYEWNPPESLFTKPLPNEENNMELYPENWDYESKYADDEHVVCGAGDSSKCKIWIYWVRYGQYLVEIRYEGQDLNKDSFAQIVQSIDPFIGEKLNSN